MKDLLIKNGAEGRHRTFAQDRLIYGITVWKACQHSDQEAVFFFFFLSYICFHQVLLDLMGWLWSVHLAPSAINRLRIIYSQVPSFLVVCTAEEKM